MVNSALLRTWLLELTARPYWDIQATAPEASI